MAVGAVGGVVTHRPVAHHTTVRPLKYGAEAPFIGAMHDLFNPAGLRMLEDQKGAIAYGYVAPRVFYARFVGQLSAELGSSYVHHLDAAVRQAPALAYFA